MTVYRFYDRVRMFTSTLGTGDVALGAAFDASFMTEVEAGAANADPVVILIGEGLDFEISRGVYTSSGRTVTRTVLHSKIAGVHSTSAKMTLAGAAQVRFIMTGEDMNDIWAALAAVLPSSYLDVDGTLAANSDVKIASQKATKTYADTKLPTTYLDTDTALAANSDVKIASQKATKTYADLKIPLTYMDTDGTLAANSDTKIASQKAVRTYVAAAFATNDAMIFRGVIDCSANPNYPAADRGDTYRVSVAGKIGGASGPNVEVGDLLICFTDGTASGTQAAVGANWNISQTNIDGAVTGPASAVDTNLASYNGTSGKVIQDSGKKISDILLVADNLSTVANKFTTRLNLNIEGGTAHGNSTYTILNTDKLVYTNAAFTASRTWTLPLANTLNAGQSIIVFDNQGTVTSTNTLIVAAGGSDTINGVATHTIGVAYGVREFISNGANQWTVISRLIMNAGGDVAIGTNVFVTQSKLTVAGSISINGADAAFGSGGQRGFYDLSGNVARFGATAGGGADCAVGIYYGTGATAAEGLRLDTSGNLGLGTASFGTSAVRVFAILNGTAPSTNVANVCQLYSESGVLKVRDPSGNLTSLSGGALAFLASANVFTAQQSIPAVKAVTVDKGTVSSGTATFDVSAASKQRIQSGGSHTWAFSNWPASGTYGEVEIDLVNGSTGTITLPTINWFKGDGTVSTTFSTMGVTLGTKNVFIIWSTDGGTTLYGKAA